MPRQSLQRNPSGKDQQTTTPLQANRQLPSNREVDPSEEVQQPRLPLGHGGLPFRGLSSEMGGQSAGALVVQAKLKVGEPDDRYEREADAVAERVVQQLKLPQQLLANANGGVGDTPDVQTNPDVSSVAPATGGVGVSAEIEAAINQAKGGGQPLEPGLQRLLSQAIGNDFSLVRIHTDAKANQLNRSIGARAFTTGRDIFFKQGLYRPHSPNGQKLIAHEMTHVMQQQTGNSPSTLIQADFEPAYVHSKTQLHDIISQNGRARDNGVIDHASKLQIGDQVKVETDSAEHVQDERGATWMPARFEASGLEEGHIRKSKVVLVSAIRGIDPTSPRKPEVSGDLSGSFSPIVDTSTASDRISSDSTSLSVAAGVEGTLMTLLRLTDTAQELYANRNAWKKLSKEGLFDLAIGGVSASASLADTSTKVQGSADGLRDAAVTSSVSGALSELKAVFAAGLNLVNLWKLYKAKRVDKGQAAIVTFQNLVGAAKSAASIATSVYDVINKSVPMSLFHTIPGLSLGVSLINLLISGGNAAGAYSSQDEMSKKSSELSTWILDNLAESVSSEGKAKIIFDVVSRGTGPTEQTYNRTKPDIRDGFARLAEATEGDEIRIRKREARDQRVEVNRLAGEATTKSAAVDIQRGKIAKTTGQLDDLIKQAAEKRLEAVKLTGQEKSSREQADAQAIEGITERAHAEQLAASAKAKSAKAKPLQKKVAEAHRLSGQADTLLWQALQLSLEAAQDRKDAETAGTLANKATGKSAALRVAAKALQKQAKALEEEASQLRIQLMSAEETLTTEEAGLIVLTQELTAANTELANAETVATNAELAYFEACGPIFNAANHGSNPAFQDYKDTFKRVASGDLRALFNDIDEYRTSLNPPKDAQEPNFQLIQNIHQTIQKYEFADKMSEINFKRYRTGVVNVFLELTSMAGDITTLVAGVTGAGAIAGQAVKAAPAAYKLVKGGGGFIQKMYRDYGETPSSKSSQIKHKEYVKHTRFIYGELAKAQTVQEVKEIKTFLEATGVDIGLWMEELGSGQPEKSVERMLLAMKQR
jgi:hypothetical protein